MVLHNDMLYIVANYLNLISMIKIAVIINDNHPAKKYITTIIYTYSKQYNKQLYVYILMLYDNYNDNYNINNINIIKNMNSIMIINTKNHLKKYKNTHKSQNITNHRRPAKHTKPLDNFFGGGGIMSLVALGAMDVYLTQSTTK